MFCSLHSENLLWGKLGRLTRDVAVARKITIRCVLYVRVHLMIVFTIRIVFLISAEYRLMIFVMPLNKIYSGL